MNPSFDLQPAFEAYFDNAATTLLDPRVVEAMRPYLYEKYGNPETPYHLGLEARDAVEKSRQQIADLLEVKADRIFFTSGGTESNNWALKGFRFLDVTRKHLAISAVEHASIMKAAAALCGFGVSYYTIPVDKTGTVDLAELEKHLSMGGASMASIQWANNELGSIQPMKEIAAICAKYNIILHSDAVQAFGKIAVHPEDEGVAMVSLSAHKIHGPMGIGALYIAEGIPMDPLLHGGGQEGGMRSGTHAVHQIVGFGAAAELSWSHMDATMKDVRRKIDLLSATFRDKYNAVVNGSQNTLPNILNFTIPGIETTILVAILNQKYGICLGTGSACSTRDGKSHVLEAIGVPPADCYSTLRISLSRLTTDKQVAKLIGVMDFALNETRSRGSMI